MRILLAEDDRLLGAGIRAGLGQVGFVVDWVEDGDSADAALAAHGYDAVVLDLGLPKRDGMAVLRRLRGAANPVPVLILTARDAIADRVGGLDAGADDYLVKPFDLAELQARLRALLRRARGGADPVLRIGRLTIDSGARRVALDGVPIALSARELAVLERLAANAGRVLSKAQIEDGLYGWGDEIESNAVEVYVHHLRRKLFPELIRTVRGVGYTIPAAP